MVHNFIAGKWCNDTPETSATDVNLAVQYASHHFLEWYQTAHTIREEILLRAAKLFLERKESIARTIRDEIGKPLWEAKLEVESTAGKAANALQAEKERFIETSWSKNDLSGKTNYRPLGVVGVIGPFNLPLHLPNAQIMPALLAGNVVLFKPSELAPKTAVQYMKVWLDAGLPPYALQLLQGSGKTAQAITEHKEVKGIFFTGSYETGQKIVEASQAMPDRLVALEMGGNNPIIVSSTAQTQEAALIATISSFITSGQRCTCARRLIVVECEETKPFLQMVIQATLSLRVALPTDSDDPYLGPLVSKEACTKVLSGWNKLEGKILIPLQVLDNNLVTPGIIDVTGVQVPDVELFGPVLQVIRVQSFDEAIQVANSTEYGLVASVLTQNEDEWNQAAQSLRAGIINWNMPTIGASGKAPFGGIGKSGNFRPAGLFACDSCSYPVAVSESRDLYIPTEVLPK